MAESWLVNGWLVMGRVGRMRGDLVARAGMTGAAARGAVNGLLVLLSIALFFVGLEIFLRVMDRGAAPQTSNPAAVSPQRFAGIPKGIVDLAESRKRLLTMPDEWKRRAVEIAGADRAYYWHGALHVYNADGMRHLGPYPPPRQGVFRVIVVGDSLTYGFGIAEGATFTHLLNDWMSHGETIEFLNLGVIGLQSEDIAKTVEKFIPRLKPDLIIYAVCQNDFLPSGVPEESYDFAYAIPLPEGTKAFLLEHSRAMQFTSDLYDATLRRAHLRRDVFDQILRDFDNNEMRFRRDVARMGALASAAGLPPVVGIVLDQFPAAGSRGHKITRAAEQAMQAAGFDVVSTEDYYRRYSGEAMSVSQWEGHPNEIANYIWASMIADHLRSQKYQKPFR